MISEMSYLPKVWLGSQISQRFLPTKIRPLSAHVKLTENCQAKCISCNYWQTRWEDGITTNRAIALINEIAAAGIHSLRFTGGEPLLRRDFFDILRQAETQSFKQIIVQTNGLLLKKLHNEVNASPITDLAVSIDGLKETNDRIRGIRGYFDLGLEGIRLLQGKKVVLSVTLNRMSAKELERLAAVAKEAGASVQYNILSGSLPFLKDADMAAMWPQQGEVEEITRFLRETLKRPAYEVDYISRYYRQQEIPEPPCVLGYLQVFVLSNGDVMTGCYPLKPVGNILRDKLENILASEEYRLQSEAMLRRECPGCTCGIESSLAMKHAVSGAFFELRRLAGRSPADKKVTPPPRIETHPASGTSNG